MLFRGADRVGEGSATLAPDDADHDRDRGEPDDGRGRGKRTERTTRDPPRQQPERDRRDHHAFEIVPEDRRTDDDQADREHDQRDPLPGWRRQPPDEEAGEQHGRRGELGKCPTAHAADADVEGRRVTEHRVQLEVRAGDDVDEVERQESPQRNEHRIGRMTEPATDETGDDGEHQRHADDEPPVRGRAPMAREVERAREVGRVRGSRAARARRT